MTVSGGISHPIPKGSLSPLAKPWRMKLFDSCSSSFIGTNQWASNSVTSPMESSLLSVSAAQTGPDMNTNTVATTNFFKFILNTPLEDIPHFHAEYVLVFIIRRRIAFRKYRESVAAVAVEIMGIDE